jgi:cysteine-rich repeat protein
MRSLFIFLWWMLPSVLFAQALPVCGNAIVEYGEFCDDGNAQDGDFCSSNCLFGAPPRDVQAPAPQMQQLERVRPLKAFGLSVVSSYLLGGMVPSLGHLYAGDRQRAYASWRIRMVAYGTFVVSTGFALHDFFNGPKNFDDEGTFFSVDNFCEFGVIGNCRGGALILPSILLATSTNIFDMIDAPFAARRANLRGIAPWSGGGWPYLSQAEVGRRPLATLVRPTLLPAQGAGLSLRLRF